MPAPIALFVYNRLWHTKQTVESLIQNELVNETSLHIFSDGAKSEADVERVMAVRKYIHSINGFKSLTITESKPNKGLANSIITGVSEILSTNESIIVLEDDMITSPYFLTYMNKALELYENNEEVISVHGYVWPVSKDLPETFFLRGADCWGWATWNRGWKIFDPDGQRLLDQIKERKLTYDFDFYGAYSYTRMLKKQVKGKNDSWAIRWYASAFLNDKLTLYPGKSLLRNIGNDASGTHSWDNERFNQSTLADIIQLEKIEKRENVEAKKIISEYYKSSNPSIFLKIYYRLKFIFKA